MHRLLAIAALLTLSPSSVMAQTADEIVEKHLAAIGGREALQRIRTRVSTGTVTVETAVGQIPGTVEASAKAPNKSRSLVTLDLSSLGAGKMVNDQRFDGTTGYVIDTLNGNRDITGAQLEALRNNGFPTIWLDYRGRGLTIALAGQETLAGRPAHVLEVTPKIGPRARAWVDAETLMLVKTSVPFDPTPAGPVEQVTEFGDFRTIDGVKVPFSVRSTTGGQTVAAVLTDVKHNVEVDDAVFVRP
jgi:outer membrane lipoprotein-sorting protein